MRRAVLLIFFLVYAAVAMTGSVVADEEGISAQCHPWGLFEPGAWKTVRVVVETLDDKGQVVGACSTSTKTTLIDVAEDGVTLEISSCMKVAGKRFEPEPQVVRQGFHGELLVPSLKQLPATNGDVTIEGKKIPCRIQKLEWNVPNGKTTATLYYSAGVAPYILKRECVTTDPEGEKELSQISVETISLSAPIQFRGEKRNGIKMKTVHHSPGGVVTTLADVLPDVPGGIVANTSNEQDSSGRFVRRSTLELIDYDTEPERGLFGRKHPSRHRPKPPSYYDR
jgi:hypothetical protein